MLAPSEPCFCLESLLPMICLRAVHCTTVGSILHILVYGRGWRTCKRPDNIVGFAGHTVSVVATQLCCGSLKAATGTCHEWKWLCASNTLFTKPGCRLQTADLTSVARGDIHRDNHVEGAPRTGTMKEACSLVTEEYS